MCVRTPVCRDIPAHLGVKVEGSMGSWRAPGYTEGGGLGPEQVQRPVGETPGLPLPSPLCPGPAARSRAAWPPDGAPRPNERVGPPPGSAPSGRSHPRAGNPERSSRPTGLAGTSQRPSQRPRHHRHRRPQHLHRPHQRAQWRRRGSSHHPSPPPPEPPWPPTGLHGDDRWERAAGWAGAQGLLACSGRGKWKWGAGSWPRAPAPAPQGGRGGVHSGKGDSSQSPGRPREGAGGMGGGRGRALCGAVACVCTGSRYTLGLGPHIRRVLPRGSRNSSLVPRKGLMNYPNRRQPLKSWLVAPDRCSELLQEEKATTTVS